MIQAHELTEYMRPQSRFALVRENLLSPVHLLPIDTPFPAITPEMSESFINSQACVIPSDMSHTLKVEDCTIVSHCTLGLAS